MPIDPITLSALISGYERFDAMATKFKMRNGISQINSKLDALNEKIDQMITRELKSAFDAIDDALESSNKETKEIRLRYAEEHLLKNTRINPSLSSEGRENYKWIALANFGLAYICIMRHDHKIAARHFLRTFLYDPHIARTELLPDIYTAVFEPKCSEIFQWQKEQYLKIDNNNFNIDVYLGKTLAIGAGITAFGVLAGGTLIKVPTPHVARNIEQWAERTWNEATIDNNRRYAKDQLNIELELKLDEKCKNIAESLIKEMI